MVHSTHILSKDNQKYLPLYCKTLETGYHENRICIIVNHMI